MTIVPEQTFAEAVCGELAEVVTLVPPGNSPENYEPTAQEMERFSDASVYFAIGVPTEEANILDNTGDIPVVYLQDKVSEVYPDRPLSREKETRIYGFPPKRVIVRWRQSPEKMGELTKQIRKYIMKTQGVYSKAERSRRADK